MINYLSETDLEAYRERVRQLLEEYGYEVGEDWRLTLRESP